MHVQKRAKISSSRIREKRENSLRARIRQLPRVYCSEGSRISHVLISFPGYFSGRKPESTRGRNRGSRCRCENISPVFYIILILCATPREETRNKRPRDDMASSATIHVFESKARVFLDCYVAWKFVGSGEEDSFASEFHDAIALTQSPLWTFKAPLPYRSISIRTISTE